MADLGSMQVEGFARIERKPDVAWVSFFVLGVAGSLMEANAVCCERSRQIRSFISMRYGDKLSITSHEIHVGAARADLSCTSTSVLPCGVIHLVRCQLAADASLAKEILDDAVRMGASLQHPLEPSLAVVPKSAIVYGFLDQAAIQEEALRMAFQDAKIRAHRAYGHLNYNCGTLCVVTAVSQSCNPFNDLDDLAEMPFPTRVLSTSPDCVVATARVSVTFRPSLDHDDSNRELS